MTSEKSNISRINKLLMDQKANMSDLKLFKDDAEDNSLVFRGKIIKNTYKYMRKMDKVDDMIKIAHTINLDMLENNRKAINRLERKNQIAMASNQMSEFREGEGDNEKQ